MSLEWSTKVTKHARKLELESSLALRVAGTGDDLLFAEAPHEVQLLAREVRASLPVQGAKPR